MTDVRGSDGHADHVAGCDDGHGAAGDERAGWPGDDGRAGVDAGRPAGVPADRVRRVRFRPAADDVAPGVQLVAPTLEAVLFITQNMRASDRREIFATRFDDDPAQLAQDVMAVPQFTWVAQKDGEPIAVIGAKPMWPGVWSVFAFGTDRWGEVTLSLTKHVKRFMEPALERVAHLAVAFCHERHYKAQRWLVRLGAEPIAPVLEEWGRERESFILYGWRR
jgi:hypothetical protein